jgi:fumarate reductase subunit C
MMVEGDFSNLKPYGQPLDKKVDQTTTFYKAYMVWFSTMVL